MSRLDPPRPPVAAIVFDLDGTLVDSRADIVACCQHALRLNGLPVADESRIVAAVGDGARLLLVRVTGLAADEPALVAVLSTYLAHYAAEGYARSVPMPGALAALAALDSLPLAIATHKPRSTTLPLLDHLSWSARFAVVLCGDDLPRHKPHPDPLFAIAGELGLSAASLVMVGDSPPDVLAGRAAGARTVGIPGCFLPREHLAAAAPDALLESLWELPALVASWSAR